MNGREIILSKPENVLRTHNNSGAVIYMHKRSSSVIIVALCGKMDFVFADKTVQCNKGNAVFIPAGTTYRVVCREYSESLLFNFQTNIALKSPELLGETDCKSAEDLFQKTELLFAHPNRSRYMLLSAYYELFSMFFDTAHTAETAEKYVILAESIMIKQLDCDSITCADIAGLCNISEVYLRKLFIKYRNITPSRYLLKLKMKKAKTYLTEGYSVSETAQNVGYKDVYQFSRAYKKIYGYPPSGKPKQPKVSV